MLHSGCNGCIELVAQLHVMMRIYEYGYARLRVWTCTLMHRSRASWTAWHEQSSNLAPRAFLQTKLLRACYALRPGAEFQSRHLFAIDVLDGGTRQSNEKRHAVNQLDGESAHYTLA